MPPDIEARIESRSPDAPGNVQKGISRNMRKTPRRSWMEIEMKLATRRALQRINRLTGWGETAQGFDLFAFPGMRKAADIPVERLHATYDYSAAVRYLVKLVPIDAAEVLQETMVKE